MDYNSTSVLAIEPTDIKRVCLEMAFISQQNSVNKKANMKQLNSIYATGPQQTLNLFRTQRRNVEGVVYLNHSVEKVTTVYISRTNYIKKS